MDRQRQSVLQVVPYQSLGYLLCIQPPTERGRFLVGYLRLLLRASSLSSYPWNQGYASPSQARDPVFSTPHKSEPTGKQSSVPLDLTVENHHEFMGTRSSRGCRPRGDLKHEMNSTHEITPRVQTALEIRKSMTRQVIYTRG